MQERARVVSKPSSAARNIVRIKKSVTVGIRAKVYRRKMTNGGNGGGTPNVQGGKKNKKGKNKKGNEPSLPNPPPGDLPAGSLPPGDLPSGSVPSGDLPSGSVPPGGLPSSDLPTNDPPPGDGQTSFQENTDVESEDDVSDDVIDVTVGHEWIASVERARLAVEILGQRLNGLDSDVKNLEENSLEEVNIIRKELDLRKRTELELKESITSLEFRLLDATTTI